MQIRHSVFTACAPMLLIVFAGAGVACSGNHTADDRAATMESRFSTGSGATFISYRDPYGDGRPNPLADIDGHASTFTVSAEDAKDYRIPESTDVILTVSSVPAATMFPAHVHTKPCAPPDKGGGHYQNVAGGPADETNEVHLGFTSSAGGTGFVHVRVPFGVRTGEAKSIVIHDALAVVGKYPKLACIDVTF